MNPPFPRYVIVDPKTKLQWDRSTSGDVSSFKHDPLWKPCFRQDDYGLSTEKEANDYWLIYEFQRIQYRSDLPKLTIMKRTFIPKLENCSTPTISPHYIMIQKVGAKHGYLIANALMQCRLTEFPIWVIKRRGKTKALAESISDRIKNFGMFMIIFDEADLVLAKIALGRNISYEYDMKPFWVNENA